jgi:hypothetical protein
LSYIATEILVITGRIEERNKRMRKKKIRTRTTIPFTDFEKLGYDTALQSRDQAAVEQICGLHIHAFADELQPEIFDLDSRIDTNLTRTNSLHSHLYDRPVPVSDAAMLARDHAVSLLVILAVIAGIASVISHSMTFYLIGMRVWAVLIGTSMTGVAIVARHQFFETLLVQHRSLKTLTVAAVACLCFWGLLEIAITRTALATKPASSDADTSEQSFVDSSASAEAANENPDPELQSSESTIRDRLGRGFVKIMLACDLVLGLLIGILTSLLREEDYAAWRKLKNITEEVKSMQKRKEELLSLVEIAKKRCWAGILRARHFHQRRAVPFHRALGCVLIISALMLGGTATLHAQTLNRYEGILIDVSGSIGAGGANNELFTEYAHGVRQLLLTEPPSSRVVVSTITTESFGSVREILKGWTPETHGIFTDNLTRARRQLAASFESNGSGLTPIAGGTDVFGALWHLKTLMDSDRQVGSGGTRDIWIFSDMVNETPALMMPALIGSGPRKMLEQAKANGLLVPMSGYKVHICGASMQGLSPQAWNTVKMFWTNYFQATGADLVTYSPSATADR